MPRLQASKKSLRQSLKRREKNYAVRRKVKIAVKTFLKNTLSGKIEEAKKMLPETFSIIDKAVKIHIFHPNTAARKKSLLAKKLAVK